MNANLGWGAGSTILTIVFAIFLFIIYVYARKSLKKGVNPHFVEFAPSLLTSLGIFGTFLGIVIGLLNFDPLHIDGSIQQLLAGLKTAFITSIAGIAGSIALKWEETRRMDVNQANMTTKTITEVGPRDIYQVLLRQLTSTENLQHAIGGDSERSLVGQIQMLRTEFNDFQGKSRTTNQEFQHELWGRLDTYADMMSKSATQQVIEALKEVIVQFNQRLTEQFGDNFKRLDESVKKLVEWQAQYMVQMGAMSTQYALGVSTIEATKTAVQEIRGETARIPSDMQSLAGVLTVNQHQVQELSRHLEAFVQLRNQAVQAVPQIQEQLEKIGQQLHDGAASVNTALTQGSEQFIASAQHTNKSMLEAGNHIAKQSEFISSELTDALKLLTENTEKIRTGLTQSVTEVMESVKESTSALTASTSQAITGNSAALDKALKSSLQEIKNTQDEQNNALIKLMSDNTEKMRTGVTYIIAQVMKSVQDSTSAITDSTSQAITNNASSLGNALKVSLQDIQNIQDEQSRALQAMTASVTQNTERSLAGVEKAVQEAVQLTNSGVNGQLKQLDEALTKQLNAALQELGSALGTIANHLTENYQRRTRD